MSWTDPESLGVRWVYTGLAILLSIGFLACVACYWVPAHPGHDQNGYLVGGKFISRSLTMSYAPTRIGSSEFDPHQFVGRMWVGADLGTPTERYYPKYPIGLPLLYAMALWIGSLFGPDTGERLAYCINPLAAALAVLGSYLLTRRFAGSFLGFLAAVIFATSPVLVGHATNPNSHATAVCCVTWGMYLLFAYWENGNTVRALGAGLLLGYAAIIRYSEGTLILPITLVALFTFRQRNWRSTLALFVGWIVPVGLLVIYNHAAMGATTGYDPTHESTGFALSYAVDNWETMLRQLDTNGLSLLLPLSLAGLIWMFWWEWRVASVLTAWIVPCMLIYMFYYWAPDNTNISYLRFFLTILPALALCFFWFVKHLQMVATRHFKHEIALPVWKYVISVDAFLIALPLFWMASMHLWLGDFSLTTLGWRINWFWRWLTPTDTDIAWDARSAHIALTATFGWALCGACAVGLISLNVLRGRIALPMISAGLLSMLVAGMHLTNALPALEADQVMRVALQSNVDEIQSIVPQHSLVLCSDQQVLNDLQFVGDYDLYPGDSFRHDWVQNLPSSDPPDSPQGLDPGRRDALYQRLKRFDQNQLDEQARRLILDALAAHRRVFFVVPRRDTDQRLRRNQPLPRTDRKTDKNPAQQARINLKKQLPDLVQRLCTGDRLDFDIAGTWITYVPRTVTVNSSPRGLRLPKLDPLPPRRSMELLEMTLPPT